jgi:hypothetical protein
MCVWSSWKLARKSGSGWRAACAPVEWVDGEGAPGATDGAEVAELLRREPQQDVEHHVRKQRAGVGGGGGGSPCARIDFPEGTTAAPTPSMKPTNLRTPGIEKSKSDAGIGGEK